MTRARALRLPICALLAIGMAGCFSAPHRPDTGGARPISPQPTAGENPPPPESVPDVVPRAEPLSRYGNPPFYDVMGRRYFVLSSSVGYVERGVASWYGPGFHKVRTSTGEPYDMYGMTAAHKTLPLPAYVRVTNLQNGRSIVVRVNDRGPFVGNRIIDLSYTAAYKLDMLRNGTAMVEVRTIEPVSSTTPLSAQNAAVTAPYTASSGTAPANTASSTSASRSAASPNAASSSTAPAIAAFSNTAPVAAALTATPLIAADAPSPPAPSLSASSTSPAPVSQAPVSPAASTPAPGQSSLPAGVSTVPVPRALFIQAGAFSDPKNAEHLLAKLQGGGYGKVFVRDNEIAGRRMYRVRIGPVPDVAEFDRVIAALERVGINDAHLALD